jgi:hypothetical protein
MSQNEDNLQDKLMSQPVYPPPPCPTIKAQLILNNVLSCSTQGKKKECQKSVDEMEKLIKDLLDEIEDLKMRNVQQQLAHKQVRQKQAQ